MVGFRRLAVLAACVAGADARFFPFNFGEEGRSHSWTPARETADLRADAVVGPQPTSPPPGHELRKRASRTCGYVDGQPGRAVTCVADTSECRPEPAALAFGCCAVASCTVWTACLPYSSSALTNQVNLARTRYCSNSASPACGVYKFADPLYSGYTMNICVPTSTTILFYVSPFAVVQSTTTTSRTSTTSIFSTTSTSSTSTTRASTSATLVPVAEPTAAPQSAPVGAIVGGVVGGVGGLALIAVGVFLLFFRRKKKTDPAPPPPTQTYAAGGPGAHPQVWQQPAPAGNNVASGFYDPRSSVAKPALSPSTGSYDLQNSSSPPHSPPPIYPPTTWGQGGHEQYPQSSTPDHTAYPQSWGSSGGPPPHQWQQQSAIQPQYSGPGTGYTQPTQNYGGGGMREMA